MCAAARSNPTNGLTAPAPKSQQDRLFGYAGTVTSGISGRWRMRRGESPSKSLDQTVTGTPVHYLSRLGLSLAFAARGSALPGVTIAKILEELIAGYQSALA